MPRSLCCVLDLNTCKNCTDHFCRMLNNLVWPLKVKALNTLQRNQLFFAFWLLILNKMIFISKHAHYLFYVLNVNARVSVNMMVKENYYWKSPITDKGQVVFAQNRIGVKLWCSKRLNNFRVIADDHSVCDKCPCSDVDDCFMQQNMIINLLWGSKLFSFTERCRNKQIKKSLQLRLTRCSSPPKQESFRSVFIASFFLPPCLNLPLRGSFCWLTAWEPSEGKQQQPRPHCCFNATTEWQEIVTGIRVQRTHWHSGHVWVWQ